MRGGGGWPEKEMVVGWAEASKKDQRGALARDSEHVGKAYVKTEGFRELEEREERKGRMGTGGRS